MIGPAHGRRKTARRGARLAAAFALAAAAFASAAPLPGTPIANQATATGVTGVGVPFSLGSNTVSVTVSAGAATSYSAVLAASQVVSSQAGATVYVPHTLTNTGTLADTYTLAVTPFSTGGWSFASADLFADFNGDGLPDSATPLAAVSLGPAQALRFVARYVVPPGAPMRTQNDARISATSTGNAAIAPIADRVMLGDTTIQRDCGTVTKVLSRERGPSPAGPVTVTLAYSACDKARAKMWIRDPLPAGFKYIPGSARWSGTGAAALSDAAGDRQGAAPQEIEYDFGVTAANTAHAVIHSLPANGGGFVSFDVEVAGGLATGSSITNVGEFAFYDAGGTYGGATYTNPATYHVSGRAGLELLGERLATVQPGATVLFTNVLTNRGDTADTYDIMLAGSTFPPGTTLTLLKSDGATPLADTDGNGTPDTGVVAAGASYRIVVRARLPESAPQGSYQVTKVARSAAMPALTASADDVVEAVAKRCVVSLDPDNDAQVGFGQRVTYTHYLTNRGNCAEDVRAAAGYLADSRPGWASRAFVDNRASGGASLPGALDATDTAVVTGWSATLAPGETLRVLVEVVAPTAEALSAAKAAPGKAAADTNVTTLVVTSSNSGPLTVRDTTTVGEKESGPQMPNTLRNYTDATYGAPTVWAVSGGQLWLKAEAGACNASATEADVRTVVITGPNGEREEALARETGPNTGVFTVPAMPVRAPPVRAGDGVVQGRPGDVFDIELAGCGRPIATVVTLMDAVSVVFDSRSNAPVGGATVTLVSASGGRCGTSPVTLGGAQNPVVTRADGRFELPPLPAGSYCVAVRAPNGYRFPSQVAWPQLPAGRNLIVTGPTSGGSYGGAFSLAAGGVLVIDVPVDSAAQDGLFVQKIASRAVADVGELVDYTVRVRNGTGNVLDRAEVSLVDQLPAGFALVPGSARRDGRALEVAGGVGPRLTLRLGAMSRDEEATITYRVRLGPGSAQGDGVNRVQARYAAGGVETLSNVATARVQVNGGVFTDKGFILGKVFMDCNADGVQGAGEPGVPGVRMVLEDGTHVLTDGGGKFSFYGIANRTHVVKADRTTLPAGARLAAISARHLGDGGSRVVDLKAGELQRADFAIAGCAPAVAALVRQRIEAAATADEISTVMNAPLATEARVISDVKALPASGTVGLPVTPAPDNGTRGQAPAGAQSLALAPDNGARGQAPAGARSPALLEKLLPTLDNTLAFVGVTDGQTLDYAQANLRVKGTAGATFRLTVNGAEVPASRVGKRAVLQDKQVQAWEYIGIDFRPGENVVAVTQVDAFGNARGSASVRLVAPDTLGRIALEAAGGAVADGKTAVTLVVKLADARGTPVTVRTPVTLEASAGRWGTADLNPAEPGLQVMVEGGRLEVSLLPPAEPGPAQVTATSGTFKSEVRIDFLPELRSLIANGVVEGIVNLRNVKAGALAPVRESDAFERELRHLSREWNQGRTQAGVRSAFFLKGKIRGDYLLTAAYDSDKDTRERLFRDIQPDEFYPVYGDAGVRGFDAQSTSRLYVRVDHQRSYLLWGDFTTQATGEARKLANYSRSLTGVKQHFENGRVSANAFASRDSTRQVIDELRANGTSGPYLLGTPGALVNSEKVEIVTRDRNQPAVILASVAQARFSDYEIEALTGRILFRAPVPSVDRDLNPLFVRVTYEVDQGGEQFWVAGVDAQVKVTERIEVGGSYVKDQNPLAPFALAGANATVKLGESTFVVGEVARSEAGVDAVKGDAARVEVKHESEGLKARAFVARTDAGFQNPGAYLSQGRSEAGGRLDYKLTPRTSVRAEALRTEDVASHTQRDGLAAALQHQLADRLTVELGVRHAAEKGAGSPVPAIAAPGGGTLLPQPMPDEVTTVRARVTSSIPGVDGLSMYAEAEVDVKDADRRVLAAGGEYQLPNKGRLYARHEFVSSITGPYGLNANERQNTTAIGVDTEYMKDGRLFSEYRIRDAMSGGDTEAALGLKNLWSIAPGLRLGSTLERVQSLSGTGQNENTAVALALEYTAHPLWKGSTRLEVRDSQASDSLLFTVGLAARLARDWTALARNAYTVTRQKETGGKHAVERMQAGLAFRDDEANRWNALARVEHRREQNDTTPAVNLKSATTLVSMHADWQLTRPFLVTGRYAAKWTTDKSNGLSSKYRAQVVGGRGTWEFAPRWDVSLVASTLFGDTAAARQYGVGLEVGYLLATNLWVSAGYNLAGYRDADLAGADYTARGPFVRLRYKFDESLLPQAGEGK